MLSSPSSFLLLAALSLVSPQTPKNTPAIDQTLETLKSENSQLKEKLNFLEARREAFRWNHFTEGPLLRSGSVLYSALTPEGRLAFCTDNQGLIFYDGTRFETLSTADSPLPDDFVTALAPLGPYRALVGTGHGITLYDQGRLRALPDLPAELANGTVSCLIAAGENDIWAGTQGLGLWRKDNSGWHNYRTAPDSSGLTGDDINSMALDPATAVLWVATAGGGVCRLSGDVWESFRQPLGPGSAEVYTVLLDSDGLLWAGTVSAGAGYFDGVQWHKAPLPLAEGEGVINIASLEGGDLFFGTTAGSFIYERKPNRWLRLPVPEELAPYPMTSAREAFGRLWLSPAGQGLYLYDRGVISRFSAETGLPSDIVYHLEQSADGLLWCCTWNGVGVYDGRRWKAAGASQGFPEDLVTFILFGSDGAIYFGTHKGAVILKDGKRFIYDRDNGLLSNTVNHLALDRDNGLWISTEGGGLVRLRGDSLTTFRTEEGLPANQVQASAQDGSGTVWAATKKGIVSIQDGRVIAERPKRHDEISPGEAQFTALLAARDGSLWAATYGDGLWRKGPAETGWRHYTVEDGLGANEVYALAEVPDGRLFCGTETGLSLFDGAHWRSYSAADGLDPGSVRTLLSARDSSLWLGGTEHGIIRFDPDRRREPETYLLTQSGLALGLDPEKKFVQLAAAGDSGALKYSADTTAGRVYLGERFYYPLTARPAPDTLTTPSLSLACLALTPWWNTPAAQFRYSYKLDDGTWSDFSFSGALGLYDLKPGPHLLYLRAKGPDLRVDLTPAEYRFFVDIPTLWSDWRIYALGALLALLICAVLWRRTIGWWLHVIRHRHFRPVTPNPFNPNAPLLEKERFVGRDELLETLKGLFAGLERGSVIVQANEKIGLTSFLMRTAETARSAGAGVYYLDPAAGYFPGVGELVDNLCAGLSALQKEETPAEDQSGGSLDKLLELAGKSGAPVVFIFDNAELLGRLIQRDPLAGTALLSCFRELVLSDRGASFIFGLQALETFREQAGAIFDMSRLLRLGAVGETEARSIIAKPLEGRAFIHGEALSLLSRLAGGHPFLLACIGQELVEQINHEQTNLVTLELASRAVAELVQDPPILLLDRWEELTKREKLLLAAVYSVLGPELRQASLSLADVAGILSSHRITLLEEELAKASADLARRGLLALQEGTGRLLVEDTLLGRWIAAGQSVEAIDSREEYEVGDSLRRLGEELSHSFRINELAGRVLGLLEALLHFEWGALLVKQPSGEEGPAVRFTLLGAAGDAAGGLELPAELPLSGLEKLTLQAMPVVVGEAGEPGREPEISWPLETGSLLAPLLARGVLVGLLALGRRRDGERYSRRDRLFVQTLAEQVAVSMENVRLYEEETEKERLQQELDTARRMQMAILPVRKPDFPGLDVFAYLNPATEVGGDYFDYHFLEESGKLIFTIADVSGHGISAGTLVYMTKSCIYNQIRIDYEVEKVMAALNDMVYGALSERLLMTFCYAIFDLRERTLTYSIAGHPFPYHYSAESGSLKEMELAAYPLGVMKKARFKVERINYAPGDVFAFYSDGIIEALDPAGEQFGFERFADKLKKSCTLDAEGISRGLLENFDGFRSGVPQADDVTLVIIKVR